MARPRPMPKPKFKPPIIPPSTTTISKKTFKGAVGKLQKGFQVQVKREGKFSPISKKILPKGLALKLGSEKVKTTLARTFRLVEKGVTTEKDIKFTPNPLVFRPPKKAKKPLTFVQKRKFALSSRTEVSEIMTAKKRKGKKNGFF